MKLEESDVEKIKRLAEKDHRSMSDYCRVVILQHLREEEEKEKEKEKTPE